LTIQFKVYKIALRNGFRNEQLKGAPHKDDKDKQDAFIEESEEIKAPVTSNDPILFMNAPILRERQK